MLKDIERGGNLDGIGKPEALKDNLVGYYSRRIDDCHRLVYCKKGDIVGVKGRIQTSNYETKDGKNIKLTQVVAEKITFLSSNKNSD